jgi:hypothetical protein
VGQRESTLSSNINLKNYFEELQSFNLSCDGSIKMAHCEKGGEGGLYLESNTHIIKYKDE